MVIFLYLAHPFYLPSPQTAQQASSPCRVVVSSDRPLRPASRISCAHPGCAGMPQTHQRIEHPHSSEPKTADWAGSGCWVAAGEWDPSTRGALRGRSMGSLCLSIFRVRKGSRRECEWLDGTGDGSCITGCVWGELEGYRGGSKRSQGHGCLGC